MDASERSLLEATVADAIAAVPDGGARAVGEMLARLGWLDLLSAEPAIAIAVVFDALGRANAASDVLDDVTAMALGIEPRTDLAVLLPSFGKWQPPGHLDDVHLRALGLATARFASAGDLVVVGRDRADLCIAALPITADRATPLRGIDPDGGMFAVDIDAAAVTTTIDGARWEAAVALAQRAIAHQLAGASRTMLELARTHATERVQFGRRVARFQAVRHRLADAFVAIEALDAALAAAADEPTPQTAALAKVIAGRTARTVATHAQQVLAGIGFTTDHPFHRYLKRTMLLDGLFGSTDDITLDIGRTLLRTRTVPTLVEL